MIGPLAAALVLAVGTRWSYEDAYDNVADGDWYIDSNNEEATLAWGESYVMMSLAAMFRATGHPMYLDRLARHIDAVLQQRDDARGVTDYRGVSGACWRNISYQPEPYCYAVHTGMLIYPMVELAALVQASGLGARPTYDGVALADKAATYLAQAEASVQAHEHEWNDAGYYVFAPDADFLDYPGQDVPFNQSNAMGRALVVLAALTGDAEHLAKATALAQRFRDHITTAGDGSYLWNYWGGALSGNGEDVSHAAINVDFAVVAAAHGIVFDDADLAAFARTFVQRVYVDDGTMSDFVGGGPVNGSGYRPQVARWLRLSPVRTTVYTAVHDLYAADYGPESIGSGSTLLGWALLAEHEPVHCAPFFYSVDWNDLGDAQQATAYGANILTVPPSLDSGCVVPVQVDVPRETVVAQWDGEAYHRVGTWAPTGGTAARLMPYEPLWPFAYWMDGVLFEFEDAFVAGDGIVVGEHPGFVAPAITSSPPRSGEIGSEYAYALAGEYEGPHWWRLASGPALADLDPDTGALSWTPDAAGSFDFVVRLEVDHGSVEQAFSVDVPEIAGTDDGSDAADETGHGDSGVSDEAGGSSGGGGPGDGDGDSSEDGGDDTGAGTDGSGAGARDDAGASGCGCRGSGVPAPPLAFVLLLAAAGIRRARPQLTAVTRGETGSGLR